MMAWTLERAGTIERDRKATMNPDDKPTAPQQVEIHRREHLVDDFFRLDAVEYSFQLFDGSMSAPVRRLTLERGDSVAALLVDDAGRVWLIEQFRIATWPAGPGWLVETAAGIVAPGESPEAALRREVFEETGFEIERLEPIASVYLSPGGSSERVHLYCAGVRSRRGVGGGVAAEGEDIRLVAFSRDELAQAWRAGRFVDAKTLLAVQWFLGGLP
jgi:ADP-ribose pyrophosphatase